MFPRASFENGNKGKRKKKRKIPKKREKRENARPKVMRIEFKREKNVSTCLPFYGIILPKDFSITSNASSIFLIFKLPLPPIRSSASSDKNNNSRFNITSYGNKKLDAEEKEKNLDNCMR
jgi:hypothetical protein